MRIKSFIVDAFTDELFKGNQAAVCLLDHPIHAEQMIHIAKEFGYSETAFLIHLGANNYNIRYFSPKMEIPLCGHATLASAKALFDEDPSRHQLVFDTHSGYTLEIAKEGEDILMNFPKQGLEKASLPDDFAKAIGINGIIDCQYSSDHNILMVEIADSKELANLRPDFNTLRHIDSAVNGVLVTALSSREAIDYEYRYFWPWSGTDEDPVTGAVQSFLAPYWQQKLGKDQLHAFQCSERTGRMEVTVSDAIVKIRSRAVIFARLTIDV